MTVETVLIGLRLGAGLLWVWLGWRIAFESWGITKASQEARERGWNCFRAGLLVMAFAIVFLFTPENILRANGNISSATGYYMLCGGVAGLQVSAILTLLGLDVVTVRNARALPAYLLMPAVSILYVLWEIGG